MYLIGAIGVIIYLSFEFTTLKLSELISSSSYAKQMLGYIWMSVICFIILLLTLCSTIG